MPVFAQCLDLVDDPELVREYVELHRQVPAAVEAALRSIGITSLRHVFRTNAEGDFLPRL